MPTEIDVRKEIDQLSSQLQSIQENHRKVNDKQMQTALGGGDHFIWRGQVAQTATMLMYRTKKAISHYEKPSYKQTLLKSLVKANTSV